LRDLIGWQKFSDYPSDADLTRSAAEQLQALLAQPQGKFSHALAELADIKESQANEAILDEFAQPQGPSAQELLAAIREHKLDVAMADADTHKADRKLWSHLREG